MAHILLADDLDRVRGALARMLGQLGHTVVEARDRDGAASALSRSADEGRPFDLIVADYNFEGGPSGLDMLAGLAPGAPVILTAGDRDAFRDEDARRLGVARVLQKPIDLDLLRQAISEVLV